MRFITCYSIVLFIITAIKAIQSYGKKICIIHDRWNCQKKGTKFQWNSMCNMFEEWLIIDIIRQLAAHINYACIILCRTTYKIGVYFLTTIFFQMMYLDNQYLPFYTYKLTFSVAKRHNKIGNIYLGIRFNHSLKLFCLLIGRITPNMRALNLLV